jgi:succinate-semialdehyde dehydrogenase/glutarate-semialdehyde dehydrogenase
MTTTAPTKEHAGTKYASLGLLIDGVWRQGAGGRTIEVLNPENERVIGHVPAAEESDIDEAIDAAERGFAIWRDTPIATRTAILMKAGTLLRERSAEIGRIMTLEQGKPLKESINEASRIANSIEWDAQDARRIYGRIIPSEHDLQLSVHRHPVGPVAGFTPWNFPAGSPNRKIAGALAAGCSVVIKPSNETPGTACALAQCYLDAGLPAGVLNVVFGPSAMISEKLIDSPVMRFVAFTGSIPVGKALAAMAGTAMKPTIMELGGHAPVIVCKDADPVVAARRSAAAKWANAGQVCTSPSRLIVHESLHDEFVAEFIKATRELKVGNGLEPGIDIGPLANKRRLDSVTTLVDEAVARGAKVELGGTRLGEKGYFYAPTVLTNVPLDAKVMVDEPFGPIAPIIPFTDLDEALAIANSLEFGLAAYAFTESTATADTLVRGFEAGILSINHCGGSTPEAPSGGVKSSGHGREGGTEGVEAFLITKRVSHRLRG